MDVGGRVEGVFGPRALIRHFLEGLRIRAVEPAHERLGGLDLVLLVHRFDADEVDVGLEKVANALCG